MNLLRIVAPHFVCGVITDGDHVVEAAPIVGYMRGWDRARFRGYVRRKGWRVELVS